MSKASRNSCGDWKTFTELGSQLSLLETEAVDPGSGTVRGKVCLVTLLDSKPKTCSQEPGNQTESSTRARVGLMSRGQVCARRQMTPQGSGEAQEFYIQPNCRSGLRTTDQHF